jgi:EAL domain-containing protein (putative c-di-GMP-specific phosphodiesterase class I)
MEAVEAFANPTAAPILAFDLGDSRSAVMVRAVNTRRAIVGLIMIVMDTRIVAQGTPKLMTPKLQRAVVQFAAMRPDKGPALPEPEPEQTARTKAAALRAAQPAPKAAARPSPPSSPPSSPRSSSPRSPPTVTPPPAAAAPLAVGAKTIAAQLEQIVSRGPVRGPSVDAASISRPASYVSHVGATRPANRVPAPAAPAPQRATVIEVEPDSKGIPPEIDRLNAAMRKSPIALHVQRLVPLSKGGQMRRFEVLLRSGSEESPNAAPHAMLKAAVENGLGSMIDRRVITELISWLVRHPDIWRANEVMFSVNLTTTALHDEHFIKFVELCLAKSSLPKGTIAFEIDAPTALTLADKIGEVAVALHRLGCPMVLDDFALRTECFELLRLPGVRYIKLAPDLTSRMRSDKVSQAAITAVVQMARVLGMHTCAKRTDTAAEQEWLTALGVDFVQSNAISPAVSIDSLHKGAAKA